MNAALTSLLAARDDTTSSAVDQCLKLLRAKDDTSRFVGLTMLLPLLKHSDERALMREAAEALDPRFLDRLLKASESGSPSCTYSSYYMADLMIKGG
jgi:cytochrome P450